MLRSIIRKYMTDAPRRKTTRDSTMARKTLVSTFLGSEYSALRQVDDLKIFDESNPDQPPKLVCVFCSSAFVAENGSDEIMVYWVSSGSDTLATNTLDRSGGRMTASKFQSTVVQKARRLACGGLR